MSLCWARLLSPKTIPPKHPDSLVAYLITIIRNTAVNRYLARIMNKFPQYDVEMEETHHVHKLDHPSGTAITLAEDIVANIDRKNAWAEDTNDPALLRIDHIRRGEVPGIHTIRYDSDADLITISHDAHSRKGFALGAVMAAEYTATHSGLLTISDMFDF